jgi:hypothetical protein
MLKTLLLSKLQQAALLCLALLAVSASASSPKVDNFVLIDHNGKAQELYYQNDAKAVVIIVQGNGCQIVRSLLTDYQALRDDYQAKGVQVLMLNSNLQDSRASIKAEADEWGIDIPIMHDSAQIIGQSLKLDRTAEVLVINSKTKQLVYRGALNDRVHYERQKQQANKRYVRDALDAVIAGEKVTIDQVEGPGCAINFPARSNSKAISYSETIAPILQQNCSVCHVEGGIAPWAMSEYRMIQGFAPMIREVIRTKRMPPWHADPTIGKWKHDAGISDADTQTLISWIEAGAPRGEGEDPLKQITPKTSEWPLGEPDLVIEAPAFEVPANGIVEYQFPVVTNPLASDAWVVAATVIPGDTKVVHHVLLGSADEMPKDAGRESVFQNYIMGYAPGNEYAHMPEGTGVFVPKGGVYQLQLHYTPVGKAITDRTRVGLYFADETPANYLRQIVVLNPRLKIPPNAAEHEVSAYFEFTKDATIFSLVPHSHYRGRSSNFELVYPDGTSEIILSVPNYDFNWQRTYTFEQPKKVNKGTQLIHRTVYDNSVNNPGNPDPNRTVTWGLQSHDEMLYGSVSFSWDAETSSQPIHSNLSSSAAQFLGFIDKDRDGHISREEMPQRMRDGIGWKWWFLDTDFNGLDLAEIESMFSRDE